MVNSQPLLGTLEPWLQSVLPRRCGGCQRVGRSWCSTCSVAIRSQRGGLVPAPLGAPGILAVAGEHRGLLRAAILLHKSRHHTAVFGDLLHLAAQQLALVHLVLPYLAGSEAVAAARLALIPVPPSSRRAWRSPTGELAHGLAAGGTSVDYLPLLRARGRRQSQKSLDADRRARNVVGAFQVRSGLRRPGQVAVLVDDVVTTGATLSEARAVLERTGVRVLAAVALARTPGPGS